MSQLHCQFCPNYWMDFPSTSLVRTPSRKGEGIHQGKPLLVTVNFTLRLRDMMTSTVNVSYAFNAEK